MTQAVVTGGCGFIGSHLVDVLLRNNISVTVIDNLSSGRELNIAHCRDKIKFIEADISVKGNWQDELVSADYVFHIAALADIVPSIQNPEDYFRSNVTGTFNVMEGLRKSRCKKLVYAASSSCYGLATELPTPETAEIYPEYPYALTKRLGEEIVCHWGKVYKIPYISLRLFNVYGPRSRTAGTYGAMFGVFLAQKLAGKPFTVVGDGKQTRDFVFVTDVAEAFLQSALSPVTNDIFNVGSGRTIAVNKIVDLLEGNAVYIPKRPGEPDCTFAQIEKIKSRIGWTPRVQIEEGVALLLKQIDYWKDAPIWTPNRIEEATSDWFEYLGS